MAAPGAPVSGAADLFGPGAIQLRSPLLQQIQETYQGVQTWLPADPPQAAAFAGRAWQTEARTDLGRRWTLGPDGRPLNVLQRVEAAAAELAPEDRALLHQGVGLAFHFLSGLPDQGYAETNRLHLAEEACHFLELAEAGGLAGRALVDAFLASIFTDINKRSDLDGQPVPIFGVATHHVLGSETMLATLLHLPGYQGLEGREALERMGDLVLEHQFAPPAFMGGVAVPEAIRAVLRRDGVNPDAHEATLQTLSQKIADPFAHLKADALEVDLSPEEAALLARLGLDGWYVPSSPDSWRIVAADAGQYSAPQGLIKYLDILGPKAEGPVAPFDRMATLVALREHVMGDAGSFGRLQQVLRAHGGDVGSLAADLYERQRGRVRDVLEGQVRPAFERWLGQQGHAPDRSPVPFWNAPLSYPGEPGYEPGAYAFAVQMKAEYKRLVDQATRGELAARTSFPP